MKKWKGFEPAKDVEDRFKELAFEKLQEIRAIQNKFPKRLKLEKFTRDFKGTPEMQMQRHLIVS